VVDSSCILVLLACKGGCEREVCRISCSRRGPALSGVAVRTFGALVAEAAVGTCRMNGRWSGMAVDVPIRAACRMRQKHRSSTGSSDAHHPPHTTIISYKFRQLLQRPELRTYETATPERQAHDALHEMRQNLHVRTHLYKAKGQVCMRSPPQHSFQCAISKASSKGHRATEKYCNIARCKAVAFGPICDSCLE